MTENEAIKEVRFNMSRIGLEESSAKRVTEAREVAIRALEEIQQYRAIGTVEECKLAIDESIDKHNLMVVYKDRLKEFEDIGTIEEFKDLKEKSVAKKPHSISIANDIGNSMVECPICHARSDYDVKSIKRGYCWKCGQKLDWSE